MDSTHSSLPVNDITTTSAETKDLQVTSQPDPKVAGNIWMCCWG